MNHGTLGRAPPGHQAPTKAKHGALSSLALGALGLGLLGAWYFGALDSPNHLVQSLHSAAHFPVFGGIAAISFLLLRRHGPPGIQPGIRPYLVVVGFMALLSLATEGLQAFLPGRHPSVADVVTNLLGTVAFLAIFAARGAGVAARTRAAYLLLALAAATVALQPAATLGLAYLKRAAEFPVIASFSRDIDLLHIEPNGVSLRRTPAGASGTPGDEHDLLCIRLERGPYPGIMWPDPVRNWEGFRELELALVNPGKLAIELVLRIDDAPHDGSHHDRFNQSFELPPEGRSTVRFPLESIRSAPQGREFDFQQVTRMILFSTPDHHGQEFCLASIRLAGRLE